MESLGINHALCKVCRNLKIHQPTEIQTKTIPFILRGNDVIGIAETGSGKTACYSLPTLQRLSTDPFGVFALILLPTKELAFQVFEQFSVLSAPLGFKQEICLVVGGDSWLPQSKTLFEKPYIVIGTPGRIVHHLEHPDVLRSFSNLAVLVLDEADRLLSGTLQEEIQQILEFLPPKPTFQRQYLLFTATFTPILDVFRTFLAKQRFAIAHNTPLPAISSEIFNPNPTDSVPTDSSNSQVLTNSLSSVPDKFYPSYINVNPTESPVDNLQQLYLFIPVHVKVVYLVHLLSTTFKDQSGIIFTKTCQTAQILTTTLEQLAFSVTTLHSLLDHRRRVAHLAKFRSGHSDILLTTDVGSRGLDIPKVHYVLNFDFPTSFQDYVHRVGRTARVGRKGIALSLICDKDRVEHIHEVEARTRTKLKLLEVDEAEVLKRLSEVTKKRNEARVILLEQGFFDKAEKTKFEKLKARTSKIKKKEINKKSLNPS